MPHINLSPAWKKQDTMFVSAPSKDTIIYLQQKTPQQFVANIRILTFGRLSMYTKKIQANSLAEAKTKSLEYAFSLTIEQQKKYNQIRNELKKKITKRMVQNLGHV